MTDPRIGEIDTLARAAEETDTLRILELMNEIGQDASSLGMLVDRYGLSENEEVRTMLVFAINRACWEWDFEDEELPQVAIKLAASATSAKTAGVLSSTMTALQGLSARRILRPRHAEDRAVLGRFFRECVEREDWTVRSAALDALAHMSRDGLLEGLLNDEDRRALRDSLRTMHVDPEDAVDWEALTAFWEE